MATIDPLLIDLPEAIATERLWLRPPRAGDGVACNEAVVQTLAELKPWMPWAQAAPTLQESELECRRMATRFARREDLPLLIFERGADGRYGRMLGGTGLHRMDWSVPRFEIGYWRRSGEGGRGLISEAVRALTRLAFDTLNAQRVEVRMSSHNHKSRAVAERCGFTLEGVLRRDSLDVDGQARDTAVYSRVRGIEEPASPAV
jgi:RimJ/RimL family protein N-acetyltransferase